MQEPKFYHNILCMLRPKWGKCTNMQGDYVEKLYFCRINEIWWWGEEDTKASKIQSYQNAMLPVK
jgi:hypothetical protein